MKKAGDTSPVFSFAVFPGLSPGHHGAGLRLSQEFDEGFREVAELVFVHHSVRPQALRHALCHELDRRPIERRTRSRHLLRDRMAVAPLGDHALYRGDLPLDAAQPALDLVHDILAELQLLPPAAGLCGGRLTVRCHGPTIRRGGASCNTLGGMV